jgi:calcium-dependent protein kinase
LADEQLECGFRLDAMLNYHTACVFYRVMETMVPSKASSLHHSRLMYAAQKTRQASSLYQNFVRENFTGGSCSEVYEVHGTSKLGKGSYGSVYLATHRVTNDERAVKVMNVDRITSYYLRKLHTEIAILKSLDHPNIIKLQDVFFGKRSVYIVTDLCRGGELFELLNSGKNQGFVFREDRASKLMRDMLSAVNYLHENGIVHRDLKLENFLFEDNNASSPLILIDFGLSKHFTKEERLTQKVGSCYYTAPEVLNGNYDSRCDIWSLGVLCYMLLSGSPPFYGKTVEDVYNSILTKDASFADKKFKHVSNACMDFMKRLLVRDPRYRISTGEALNHPFITGAAFYPRYTNVLSARSVEMEVDSGPRLTASQCTQVLESMIVFMRADPMSRLLMEMVSHSLGSQEVSAVTLPAPRPRLTARFSSSSVSRSCSNSARNSELSIPATPEKSTRKTSSPRSATAR